MGYLGMLVIKTRRLGLYALTLNQLGLALNQPDLLGNELGVTIAGDTFSDDSRQAMMVKIGRMAYADPELHHWFTYFLVVEAANQAAIGVCGFKGPPSGAGSVEFGYAMHPDYRNKGYMTETVLALIEWAFSSPVCQTVTAETLPNNLASQRVLQKAGMHLDHSTDAMLFWRMDRARKPHGA